MKKFFDLYITYSKYIFKFWVNQISMSVFGLIVSLAAIGTGNVTVVVFSALFSIGFLTFLLYDVMFWKGFEDSARNPEEHKPDNWEGLKIGLLSYAPTLLVALIAVIFFWFNLANAYTIVKIILFFALHGSYNGFLWLLSGPLLTIPNPVIIILMFIPGLLATTLGYYLGLHDKPIRRLLGFSVKPSWQKKNKK